MPVAKIDDQEILELIQHKGLKNLDSFSVKAKLYRLEKKFNNLISRDALVAYTYLGIIEAHRNNYEISINYSQKALRISPNNLVALHNYAKSCEESGNFAEAKKYYLKALEIAPDDIDVFDSLFTLAEFCCDIDTLKVLEKISPTLYVNKSTSFIFETHYFLKEKNFDFGVYEVQISLALKAAHKYLSGHMSSVSRYFNFESNYLVNLLELEYADIDILDQINLDLESEIALYASKQLDGGFDFYEKLSQSSLNFDFAFSSECELNHAV